MNLVNRAKLATKVYQTFYNSTESFSAIGEDLAYLLGAILNGEICEWDNTKPIVRILQYSVWEFVKVNSKSNG